MIGGFEVPENGTCEDSIISSSQIVSPKWKLELLPLCHSVMGFQTKVMSSIGGGVWSIYEHT